MFGFSLCKFMHGSFTCSSHGAVNTMNRLFSFLPCSRGLGVSNSSRGTIPGAHLLTIMDHLKFGFTAPACGGSFGVATGVRTSFYKNNAGVFFIHVHRTCTTLG